MTKILASFLVFVLLTSSSSYSKPTGNEEVEWPTFPETFSMEVEAVFIDSKSEADGVVYYDKNNNRAAMDIEYDNGRMRKIYNFDENEVIEIKGSICTVEKIPDDPKKIFFPFTVDKETKNKTIGPPADVLYFTNSKPIANPDSFIPMDVYKGIMDVPQYDKKDCEIFHLFSKFYESATCDNSNCKPTLITISVKCGPAEKPVDHLYKIFRFRESIVDPTVFQAPPGVHCDRAGTQPFPTLPSYFSFSYDYIERQTDVDSPGGIHILHKKVMYDGDLQLVRIDEFDDDQLLSSSKVFDFINEVSYSSTPAISDCNMGPITDDLSLDQVTLLPNVVFPWKFREVKNEPVYVGKRSSHSLDYDVWSVSASMTTPTSAFQAISDIYFNKDVPNKQGIVDKYDLRLAYIEMFFSEMGEKNKPVLSKTTFAAVNHFLTTPRDWSSFDVSLCFDVDEKKEFELKIEGASMQKGSAAYNDLLEQLYLRTITSSGVSVVRISQLQAVSIDDDDHDLVFRGIILENPITIGYGKNNTEPDMATAYKNIETDINLGAFTFNVTNKGKETEYKATYVKEIKKEKKTDDSSLYSPGSMGAVAGIMLLLGLVIGVVGLFMYMKTRRTTESQKLINAS